MNIIPPFVRHRICNRPNLLKIVDNIGWLFFDKILRMGVGLFVGVWVARYLGPEQFGLLSFATAFTGLFGAFAGLGLQGIVVRDIVRNPECARVTLGTAAALQLIGGLLAYLIILVAIFYLRPDDALARSVVAILGSITLLKTSEIAVYWFESQVQSKYTVWVQNGVFLVFALIKVGLILLQAPIITFVWATLAEAAIVALMLLNVMEQKGQTLKSLRISAERAKSLLSDSWPLILSAIAVTIYMKIDQIMLGEMIGDEQVGIYSAAVRISEVFYFIPIVIVGSVFPAILEARKQSEDLYYERLQRLYDLMVMISISIAVLMTYVADYVVVLLFGPEFSEAGVVLAIHIWAAIFVFLGVASGKWFLAENRQILSLQRTVLGAIANVALNLWLIPAYGVVGAAVSTVVSFAIAAFIADLLRDETLRMFAMKSSSLSLVSVIRRIR